MKVARLSQPGAPAYASPVWSTFHETPMLEARVRRLVGEPNTLPAEPSAFVRCALAAGTVPLVVWLTGMPYQLHRFTEFLIASLP